MLFDLRVVLAACLATVFFAAVGFGMVAALRSPLKASGGYPSDGPVFAGPGLPRGQPIFMPAPNQPEVTGSIPAGTDPKSAPQAAAKDQPAAGTGEKSIANLIEEDAKKAAAAKHKAAEREKRRQAWLRAKALKKKQDQQKAASPWSNYFNNNSSPAHPTVQ